MALPPRPRSRRPRSIRVVAIAALAVALAVSGCGQSDSSARPAAGSPAPTAAGVAPIPIVIDTDMAPDDIVAIASLLRDPAVDVLAITVTGTGEAHCQSGMFVARSIVTMLVPEPISVSCGPQNPLGDAQPFPESWRAGVDNGSGLTLVSPTFAPDPRAAQQVQVDLAASEAAAGRRLTILTLGTLTNVAAAVELDATLPQRVSLVSMLGAIDVPGNVTPDVAGGSGDAVAEWNAHADPTAVRRVLDAAFDWTLIPLDATNSTPLTPELLAELESDHVAGPADLVYELWSRNPFMTDAGFYLWDPLAAVALRDTSVVTVKSTRLSVTEGVGLDGGRLVEQPAGEQVSVAVAADRSKFEAMLLERLRIGPPRPNAFTEVGSVEVDGGGGRCDATLDPAAPPAGLLRVTVTAGDEPLNVAFFELAGLTWRDIEAFTAAYDPTASPPPVTIVTQLSADPRSSSTAQGVTFPAGSLGIACFTGSPEDPTIALAGPFTIGP